MTNTLQATDPCDPYKKSGVFDLGLYLDSTISVIECGIEEAKTLPGIIGAHAVGYLNAVHNNLSALQALHQFHKTDDIAKE